MRRTLTASMLTAGAVLTLLTAPPPAAADSFDYRLDASTNGASGRTWVDFQNGRYGGNFAPDVTDTKCDGHPVYVRFYTNGGLWQEFRNTRGCGQRMEWGWRDFTYKKDQPATTVQYVYIKVCVDDWGPDTCSTSARRYNPYR